MTDITRGDLIKIKNREAIYSSEMDVNSEYIVLDIWKHERDVVLKIKKRICDGKEVTFSEKVFTVSGCDVEKVNNNISEVVISDDKSGNGKTTVNILGTDYRIVEKPLEGCDGYCDSTTKEIAVTTKKDSHDMGDFENYRKKTFRHEVIHAYHFESGLSENFENKQYGFSETLVDWFAYQSPKIFKTFEELGVL